MNKITAFIRLIRVHQWVKNLFVFLPLFFAFRLTEIPLVIAGIFAFIGLSFVASSIYVINDWCDIEADKVHPKKRFRPLASGEVNKKEALLLIAFLLISGFSIYLFVLKSIPAAILLGVYLIMNISYSLKLKHIPIIDISIVAIGFVIRIFIGGFATETSLSRWIVIMTFLLALFLALGKRRDDVVIFEKTGNKARKNLDGYNLAFVNAAIMVVTAVIIVAYIMYTISPEIMLQNSDDLYLTAFFVVIGLVRYLQIIFVKDRGGEPTKVLLKDHFMHFILIGWVASFILISYLS